MIWGILELSKVYVGAYLRFRSIMILIRSHDFGPQEDYILIKEVGLKNSKESYMTGND